MKIMTINVNITGMQRVSTSKKTVTQVLFDGTAEGEYFNGTLLRAESTHKSMYRRKGLFLPGICWKAKMLPAIIAKCIFLMMQYKTVTSQLHTS